MIEKKKKKVTKRKPIKKAEDLKMTVTKSKPKSKIKAKPKKSVKSKSTPEIKQKDINMKDFFKDNPKRMMIVFAIVVGLVVFAAMLAG